MIKGKKVLVTGATGFVGANLVRRLVRIGAEVHITTRPTSNKWRISGIMSSLQDHCVDLRDTDQVEKLVQDIKPNIVYHLATYGGHAFQQDVREVIDSNILSIVNLLSALSKIEYDLFVNTGSSSEYGLKEKPMSEMDRAEPVNFYGAAKVSATLLGQVYAKRFNQPVVTLRIFSPYGYYDSATRLIPTVITACLEGKRQLQLGGRTHIRDYIFIDDLLDAYLEAVVASKNLRGEIINIGSGVQHSIQEVVTKITRICSSPIEVRWEATPHESYEPKQWVADITKAKEILCWKPKVSLTSGLEKTINWVRENLHVYLSKGA
jgi:nucleoside-diphosphate-sugar epimerase